MGSTKISIIDGIKARGGKATTSWLLRDRRAITRIFAFVSLVRSGVCSYKHGWLFLKEYVDV